MKIYQPGTNFFQSRHAPYYIASPHFTQKTAGPRVLHYLCHILNELGYESYITATGHSPWLRTPLLTPDVKERHAQTRRTPVMVYPETITGNPLNGAVVARWLLNQAGHLGGEKVIRENEIIFHWDEWVLQEEKSSGRLFIPSADNRIFNEDGVSQENRKGFCYYAHKYLLSGGKISDTVKKNGLSLCQDIPRSPEEIAEILRSTEVLYCYEPSSMASEAYACGCQPIFVETDYLKRFRPNPGMRQILESDIGVLPVPPIDRDHREQIARIHAQALESVKNFIDVTQNAAIAHAQLPERLADPIL